MDWLVLLAVADDNQAQALPPVTGQAMARPMNAAVSEPFAVPRS